MWKDEKLKGTSIHEYFRTLNAEDRHAAKIDIRDGRVLGPPAVIPLATHQVRVVDGTIEVSVSAPAATAT